jgi:hypothetical protein
MVMALVADGPPVCAGLPPISGDAAGWTHATPAKRRSPLRNPLAFRMQGALTWRGISLPPVEIGVSIKPA